MKNARDVADGKCNAPKWLEKFGGTEPMRILANRAVLEIEQCCDLANMRNLTINATWKQRRRIIAASGFLVYRRLATFIPTGAQRLKRTDLQGQVSEDILR